MTVNKLVESTLKRVLEGLKLKSCRWGNLKLMSIFAPKLHTLHIFENDTQESDLGSPSDFCRVTIVADRLKKFYYIDQAALRMLHLLMELSNVEKLTLCSYTIEDLIYVAGQLPHLPMFNNLMDLIIDEDVCLDCPFLVTILQKAPCLRTLNFSGGVTLLFDLIWDPVPPCFLSHLKWIKLSYYEEENEEELSAVKFLLKNAIVLEEIIITTREYPEMSLGAVAYHLWKQRNDLHGNTLKTEEAIVGRIR
ncbi:hypothetical protein FH972_010713 [Carpinus fangiana]|uniref:FBD domain-containing protein n=1 Tax=Carpinus fangiana TaxID=176857 RepID=A0A660KRX6_9ROSI|nr:hypothetical protein FH972_010713 [Carpinus fangiana]